mgnify:CR=1 FL=1
MPRRKQTEGEKKIDISQMAEDLGVSKTTVSPCPFGQWPCQPKRPAPACGPVTPKRKTMCPICWHALVTQQSYNISLVFSRQFGNLAAPFCAKPSAPCTILPPAMIMMC